MVKYVKQQYSMEIILLTSIFCLPHHLIKPLINNEKQFIYFKMSLYNVSSNDVLAKKKINFIF